jgi:hypothetical protein
VALRGSQRGSELDDSGPPGPPSWITWLVGGLAIAYIALIAWMVSK